MTDDEQTKRYGYAAPRGYAAMAAALGMLDALTPPPRIIIRNPRELPPEISIKDDKRKRKQWLQRQARKQSRRAR